MRQATLFRPDKIVQCHRVYSIVFGRKVCLIRAFSLDVVLQLTDEVKEVICVVLITVSLSNVLSGHGLSTSRFSLYVHSTKKMNIT